RRYAEVEAERGLEIDGRLDDGEAARGVRPHQTQGQAGARQRRLNRPSAIAHHSRQAGPYGLDRDASALHGCLLSGEPQRSRLDRRTLSREFAASCLTTTIRATTGPFPRCWKTSGPRETPSSISASL